MWIVNIKIYITRDPKLGFLHWFPHHHHLLHHHRHHHKHQLHRQYFRFLHCLQYCKIKAYLKMNRFKKIYLKKYFMLDGLLHSFKACLITKFILSGEQLNRIHFEFNFCVAILISLAMSVVIAIIFSKISNLLSSRLIILFKLEAKCLE